MRLLIGIVMVVGELRRTLLPGGKRSADFKKRGSGTEAAKTIRADNDEKSKSSGPAAHEEIATMALNERDVLQKVSKSKPTHGQF